MTEATTPMETTVRGRPVGFLSDVRNQRRRDTMIAYTILILGSLIMVGPFIWMISTALKNPGDQFT